MRLFAAALLAVTFTSPAAALPLHEYSSLALSANGDRVAAVESDSEPNSSTMPDESIVIRNARTGAILAKVDPCRGCRYSDLSFAPDGRLLALVRNGNRTSIILSTGKPTMTLAEFDGIAETLVFSPDGRQLAGAVRNGKQSDVYVWTLPAAASPTARGRVGTEGKEPSDSRQK